MSHFMKHLKQPVARRANLEDDCTGHFFEQRFYSGALLTEEAPVAAMAYVDLNPVRAELAKRIEAIRDTSICDRLLENSAEALEDYLRPVLSGLDRPVAQAGASPNVVAAVEPSVAAPTATSVPREASAGPRPDSDGAGPDPEHSGDEDTEAADAEPAETSPEPEVDPGTRPGGRPGCHAPTSRWRSTSNSSAPWPGRRTRLPATPRTGSGGGWRGRRPSTSGSARTAASPHCGAGSPTEPCSFGRPPCPPDARARAGPPPSSTGTFRDHPVRPSNPHLSRP